MRIKLQSIMLQAGVVTKGVDVQKIIQNRLDEYYGKSVHNCAEIGNESGKSGLSMRIFKIVTPDSYWLVAMKLAPNDLEEKIIRYSTITYTDTL